MTSTETPHAQNETFMQKLVTLEANLVPLMKMEAKEAMLKTGKRIRLATMKVEKWEDI